jgi:anti-sigma factor RsiW
MNCGQVKRLLPSLLDEELSGRAREQIASHLASCPTCRTEFEALKADMGLLEQVGTPEVSPFLVTRVMAEIRQSAKSEGRSPNAEVPSRAFGVWRSLFGVGLGRLVGSLTAALVVAVAIGAGVFFGSGFAQTATPATANSTEAEVSYVESSTTSMYNLMAEGN